MEPPSMQTLPPHCHCCRQGSAARPCPLVRAVGAQLSPGLQPVLGLHVVRGRQADGLLPVVRGLVVELDGVLRTAVLLGRLRLEVVDHRDVVQRRRQVGVPLQRLIIILQRLLQLPIAGMDQPDVVQDVAPVVWIGLQLQSLVVVLQGLRILTNPLGRHPVAVVHERLLLTFGGGQKLQQLVCHHRKGLVDEIVILVFTVEHRAWHLRRCSMWQDAAVRRAAVAHHRHPGPGTMALPPQKRSSDH
mmetsp:Transcript_37390/g.61472  ORF Transcript_37390/g.61472 Transcript_37390/m.61472 type:complete len:245 (+) Transcript_37390:3068-3802(+)